MSSCVQTMIGVCLSILASLCFFLSTALMLSTLMNEVSSIRAFFACCVVFWLTKDRDRCSLASPSTGGPSQTCQKTSVGEVAQYTPSKLVSDPRGRRTRSSVGRHAEQGVPRCCFYSSDDGRHEYRVVRVRRAGDDVARDERPWRSGLLLSSGGCRRCRYVFRGSRL